MPHANIEIVDRLIAAWGRRDLESALDEMHPRCEIRGVEARETLRGHEGVAAGFRDWFEAFEEFTIEPESFTLDGDRVLVAMRQRARGKGSGIEIEQRFYQLFTLRDGMVFRFEEYSEEADAWKALGGPDTIERMEARSNELMLVLERVFAAPAPVVIAAFTDANELAKWWGPEGFAVPSLDFPARAGERYRVEMKPPEGDAFRLTGEFREVDPPERLAFTFNWEPPDPDDVETLVTLSFRDRDGSTAVALEQGAFKTEARRELHRDGWGESFDRLERLLAERV